MKKRMMSLATVLTLALAVVPGVTAARGNLTVTPPTEAIGGMCQLLANYPYPPMSDAARVNQALLDFDRSAC